VTTLPDYVAFVPDERRREHCHPDNQGCDGIEERRHDQRDDEERVHPEERQAAFRAHEIFEVEVLPPESPEGMQRLRVFGGRDQVVEFAFTAVKGKR